MNDVLGESLEVKKLRALLLKFHTFTAKRLRQEAGQIGHCKEPQKIHDQPGTQARDSGRTYRGARDLLRICQYRHGRQKKKTNRRSEESNPTRKQNTPDDNHEKIERNEIALLQAGRIHQQRNHGDVAGNLQTAMPSRLRDPPQKDKVENSDGDPEDDQGEKEAIAAKTRDILRPDNTNGQDEGDRQKTNTRQPLQ